MGLLPLEFTECLQDSPYFRDSLHSHEKELERTSNNMKELIKEVKNLLNAAKGLSAAQRRLSNTLINFKFECIGNQQTDDELIIAGSLREFGRLIGAIEDERDHMLNQAFEQFILPLENFRKEHIGAVKEGKKKFDKLTAKFCASQERHLGLSRKKQDTVLQDADAGLEMEHRDFIRAGLEYVCLIQEVQERKKFEFVETLLGFMYGWLTFYHAGHEVASDYKPHMTELQTRIQKTRENFNASRADIHALMRKMLEVRQSKSLDPGTLNKMFTRSGYLFLMEKKALGTTWNKCYCHYQREGRIFCMIPYNQTTAKIVSTDTFRLKSCIRRVSDSIDKRFCFDITPEEKPGVVYTFQALSEEDCALWMDAMDGKEPMYVNPPKPGNAHHTFLDEAGFSFVSKCFHVLENRGLEDQGLYRVGGITSKVNKLLTIGLDRKKCDKLNFEDPKEVETKTLTSAIKTFLRNLPEPIMTYKMHSKFISAAKLDTYEARVVEVQKLTQQLPEPNKRMLELLLAHLEKVSQNVKQNMMTVSNLGVCFGPTLLRNEEETVAAIMDIKFGNVVVEILIENWRFILCGDPPKFKKRSTVSNSSLTVLPMNHSSSSLPGVHASASPQHNAHMTTPPHIVSPNRPPPPPYHPPPPPQLSTSSLGGSVIQSNGVKHVHPPQTSLSPHAVQDQMLHHSASGNHLSVMGSPNSYNSATWERPLRSIGSTTSVNKTFVPQPLGSAPPSSTMHVHRPIQPSLSNSSVPQYSHSQMEGHVVPNRELHQHILGNNHSSYHPPPQLPSKLNRQSSGNLSGIGSNKSSPSYHNQTTVSDGKTRVSSNRRLRPKQPPPPTPNHPPYVDPPPVPSSKGKGGSDGHGDSSSGTRHRFSSSSSVDSFASYGSGRENYQSSKINRQSSSHSSDNVLHEGSYFDNDLDIENRVVQDNAADAILAANDTVEAANAIVASTAMFGSPAVVAASQTATVQPIQQLQQTTPMSSSSPSSTTSSTTAAAISNTPSSSSTMVRTLYACVGEHDTELSFEPNQIITGVRPSLEPGWLQGVLDGKIGLVPENYVEFIT